MKWNGKTRIGKQEKTAEGNLHLDGMEPYESAESNARRALLGATTSLEGVVYVDYDQALDQLFAEKVFTLEDVPVLARQAGIDWLKLVARGMKEKNGEPRIIPNPDNAIQGILMDFSPEKARTRNTLNRALQLFGVYKNAWSSRNGQEARNDPNLVELPEFKDGWQKIRLDAKARWRVEVLGEGSASERPDPEETCEPE